MGKAIADCLLTVMTLGMYDPERPSGQVTRQEAPSAPAKAEPEPKTASRGAKWTHAWRAVTLVGKGLNGEAKPSELTCEAIGLAADVLQKQPSEED
jgi:hypothetical protein